MKIIKVSNFDSESVSDVLIAEKVLDHYVDSIVNALNEKYSGVVSTYFFRAVADDHKLYVFEP